MTETPDTPDATTPDEQPEFLNRAARRAKGKKGQSQNRRLDGAKQHGDTHGAAHAQRNYGHRRSG